MRLNWAWLTNIVTEWRAYILPIAKTLQIFADCLSPPSLTLQGLSTELPSYCSVVSAREHPGWVEHSRRWVPDALGTALLRKHEKLACLAAAFHLATLFRPAHLGALCETRLRFVDTAPRQRLLHSALHGLTWLKVSSLAFGE